MIIVRYWKRERQGHSNLVEIHVKRGFVEVIILVVEGIVTTR